LPFAMLAHAGRGPKANVCHQEGRGGATGQGGPPAAPDNGPNKRPCGGGYLLRAINKAGV
jgi:hypothetical protein